MNLLAGFNIAIRAIFANRLRSALTALGLVIGVSSVIVLIAVGQGAQQDVVDRIRGLGTDLIFVQPGISGQGQAGPRGRFGSALTLTDTDAQAIAEAQIDGITSVVSQINLNAQAIAGPNNLQVPVIGTTSEYPGVRGLRVAEGGFISHRDVDRKALSIVLGSLSASTLFPDQDPLGRSVRLSLGGGRITFNFRVIGVMEQEGSGGESETHDNSVFIPVSTLQSRIGRFRSSSGDVNVTQISIQTGTDANKELVKAQITDLLLRRHLVAEPDFVVQSQEDLVSASNEVTLVLSILLGSIAGISLVVGGIGVMNIMLVSVTERTREIGIRRALGARSKDIMTQFVIEALTLCATGGVLGIVLGVGLSMAVSGRQIGEQDVTTVVQTWSIAVAFVVAALVGLLSGSYPAYRAARLDPIEALRTE